MSKGGPGRAWALPNLCQALPTELLALLVRPGLASHPSQILVCRILTWDDKLVNEPILKPSETGTNGDFDWSFSIKTHTFANY